MAIIRSKQEKKELKTVKKHQDARRDHARAGKTVEQLSDVLAKANERHAKTAARRSSTRDAARRLFS